MNLKFFLVAYALVEGTCYGRHIDDSKEQKNVGRRPKDIIYKQDGSFYITYDTEEDSGSQGYYADYKRSESDYDGDDDDDASDEDYYVHDGDESNEDDEYSSEYYSEELRNKKHKKIKKKIDASTAEAELIEYPDKKNLRENETNTNINSVKDKSVKRRPGSKFFQNINNVKITTVMTTKRNHKENNKKNKIHNEDKTMKEEKETKIKIQENKKKQKKKIGKIKERKFQKFKKEREKAKDETEIWGDKSSYEEEEEGIMESGSKRLPNESDDDYNYDELKKQLEQMESVEKSKKQFSSKSNDEYDEENKKKGIKNKSGKRVRQSKQDINKKGTTRKEIKARRRSSIKYSGKRIGKQRVGKVRSGVRQKNCRQTKNGRRGREKVKEGIESYKKTEDERIHNEDFKKNSKIFGRQRQFNQMLSRQRVKEFIEEQDKGRGGRKRYLSVAAKNFAKKQKLRKRSQIKRHRKSIAEANKKLSKVQKKIRKTKA